MFSQYNLFQSYESEIILVEIFRDKVKKAAKIAKLIRTLEKEKEKMGGLEDEINRLRIRFAKARAEVKRMIDELGPLLEYAHRRELEREEKYKHKFYRLSKREAQLKLLVEMPTGDVLIAQDVFEKMMSEEASKGEINNRVRREIRDITKARDYLRSDEDLPKLLKDPLVLAELEDLSRDTGYDLISYSESLISERKEERLEYKSKNEVEQQLKETSEELDRLWQEDLTRYYIYQDYLEKLISQDQLGEPVLEIPSVTKLMNKLAAWERRHTETPIGGVLIGPPGTGKSLGVEYYLANHPEHRKKGPPIIIDMSQETTEFILLGGEAIEITDKAKTVEALTRIFEQEEEIERRLGMPETSEKDKEILREKKKN